MPDLIISSADDLVVARLLRGKLQLEIALGAKQTPSVYDTICKKLSLRGDKHEILKQLNTILEQGNNTITNTSVNKEPEFKEE